MEDYCRIYTVDFCEMTQWDDFMRKFYGMTLWEDAIGHNFRLQKNYVV